MWNWFAVCRTDIGGALMSPISRWDILTSDLPLISLIYRFYNLYVTSQNKVLPLIKCVESMLYFEPLTVERAPDLQSALDSLSVVLIIKFIRGCQGNRLN